jgi:hypothetical protein
MDYLEFVARVTSHIPDKGQVMVRYYSLYANAHRGKVRKAAVSPLTLRMSEEELKPVPSKGWAALIRKVSGPAIFMFLTVVLGPRYSHFRMRIIDSKLNGSKSRATRETNFLYIN